MFSLFRLQRNTEERKSRHKFGGTKVCKDEEVRKYFENSKIEIEVLSYIIYRLDLKNISCTLFLFRSSHPEVFCKKSVLRYFSKSKGKHLCHSLFFNKKVTLAQVFSCEFCEISKNNSCYRTLLYRLLFIAY